MRVMSPDIVLEEAYVAYVSICSYATQIRKSTEEKESCYADLTRQWATNHTSNLIHGTNASSGHVSRNIDGFEGAYG